MYIREWNSDTIIKAVFEVLAITLTRYWEIGWKSLINANMQRLMVRLLQGSIMEMSKRPRYRAI